MATLESAKNVEDIQFAEDPTPIEEDASGTDQATVCKNCPDHPAGATSSMSEVKTQKRRKYDLLTADVVEERLKELQELLKTETDQKTRQRLSARQRYYLAWKAGGGKVPTHKRSKRPPPADCKGCRDLQVVIDKFKEGLEAYELLFH